MSIFGCNCRSNCTVAALIVSAILGVIAAFLQITGMITVTPAFLWVVFGIAVVYLLALVVTAALLRRTEQSPCRCTTLTALLAGVLVAALFAVILLAVGIVATSVVSAILVGVLVFGLALTLAGTACFVRCLFDCAG